MNRWKKWLIPILMLAFLFPWLETPAGALNLQRINERYSCTAGENLTIGNLLVIKSDALCYKADADDAALRPAVGVAASTVSSGSAVGLITRGLMGGATGLTAGGRMYLSTVAGAATQTQPSAYSQVVGLAPGSTSWGIDIHPPQAPNLLITDVETLAAGVDIGDGSTWQTARAIYEAPRSMTIHAVYVRGRAAVTSVVAYGNVVRVYQGTSVVVAKSYNSTTLWPAAYTLNSLGTVTNANVTAGKSIFFEVVNGLLFATPAWELIIEYFTGE